MFDKKYNNFNTIHTFTFAKEGTTKSTCKYYEKKGYEDIGGFCSYHNKACIGNSCPLLKGNPPLTLNELIKLKKIFISAFILREENKNHLLNTSILNKNFKKELRQSFKRINMNNIPEITDLDIQRELKAIEQEHHRYFDVRYDRLHQMTFKEISILPPNSQ